MLAVKNILPCQMIPLPTDLEVLCNKLNLPDSITCCVSYNPQNSSSTYWDNLLNHK